MTQSTATESALSAKASFSNIYTNKLWGDGKLAPLSGIGSSEAFTLQYRSFLLDFFKRHSVTSVVDLGCGDWTFSRLIDWKDIGICYNGYDVYDKLIASHQQTLASAQVNFHSADVSSSDFAFPHSDVYLIKDVVQHWPNQLVTQFMHRLMAAKPCRYVLMTNTSGGVSNETDIPMGGYRPLNMSAWPMSDFPFSLVLTWGPADDPKQTLLMDFTMDRDKNNGDSRDVCSLCDMSTPASALVRFLAENKVAHVARVVTPTTEQAGEDLLEPKNDVAKHGIKVDLYRSVVDLDAISSLLSGRCYDVVILHNVLQRQSTQNILQLLPKLVDECKLVIVCGSRAQFTEPREQDEHQNPASGLFYLFHPLKLFSPRRIDRVGDSDCCAIGGRNNQQGTGAEEETTLRTISVLVAEHADHYFAYRRCQQGQVLCDTSEILRRLTRTFFHRFPTARELQQARCATRSTELVSIIVHSKDFDDYTIPYHTRRLAAQRALEKQWCSASTLSSQDTNDTKPLTHQSLVHKLAAQTPDLQLDALHLTNTPFYRGLIWSQSYQKQLQARRKIPARIMQTWKINDVHALEKTNRWGESHAGKLEMQSRYFNDAARVRSWQQLNPNYHYELLDDRDIEQFVHDKFPQYESLMRSMPAPIMRIDLFRILYLYEYGGVYADFDTECLRPLDELIGPDDDLILGLETDLQDKAPEIEIFQIACPKQIAFHCFASAPKHPLLRKLIDEAVLRANKLLQHKTTGKVSQMDVLHTTGPGLLTSVAFAHLKDSGADEKDGGKTWRQTVLSTGYFSAGQLHSGSPRILDEAAFIVHMFCNSWFHEVDRKKVQ